VELPPKVSNRRAANLTSLVRQFTGKNLRTEDEEIKLLRALNLVATRRRVQARTPTTNIFHQYLARLFNANKLVLCVTNNIDGLETQYCEEMEEALVMIRGDNRRLECSSHHCEGLAARPDYIETAFLRGETAECPSCCETGEYRLLSVSFIIPLDFLLQETTETTAAVRSRIPSDTCIPLYGI
jgi:NAD-dependent SIR2 family protein deacetylase